MSVPFESPSRPNLAETTSTTLPLLSTVLAGFAVTIIAQLFSQISTNQNFPPLSLGLICLAISVPWFLTVAVFSVWAQGYNYLKLTSDVTKLLKIKPVDLDPYIERAYKKWVMWYRSANVAFFLGVIAFIVGTGILLWNYLGLIPAIIYVVITLLSIVWGAILIWKEKRIKVIITTPVPTTSVPPTP